VSLELTSAYDYDLPEGLIATHPTDERRESRLMVLSAGATRHLRFADIVGLLRPGDLLVRNTVRVLPARLLGRKPTGGRVELLVLEPINKAWDDPGPTAFHALGRSARPLEPGTWVELGGAARIEITGRGDNGAVIARTECDASLRELLDDQGEVPLPPYIRRARKRLGEPLLNDSDAGRYQTVYATTPGAVAAPTAGLHFDAALLEAIRGRNIDLADLQLDIGIGTFRPIGTERLDEHTLHVEQYTLPESTAEAINLARSEGRRIVAVGTTSFRALEDQARRREVAVAGSYETDLFVRPRVPIHWVDAMITNFHLPRSSLLTLVCAFSGYDRVMDGYRDAVSRSYRFYSYGDAMLLERGVS
jgi:S-adenosylmethionine:tRNA ribosyltransferase-isomerase